MSNEHLGGSYIQGDANTLMPDVWGYLMLRYQVESLLDLGCGHGHTMKWFADMQVKVRGVEGDPVAVQGHLVPAQLTVHDYNQGGAPLGEERFDLGWAAEFVEHVDEQFIPHYMQDLRRCRMVCITHAEPWQNGHHHVTLHEDDWWVEQFAAYGFTFLPSESARLRLTDRWHAGWGRRTLMLFRNVDYPLLSDPSFVPLIPIYAPPSP